MRFKPPVPVQRHAIVLLLALAGCGQHYWQRPGGTVQDFERDSLPCVEEARTARIGAEELYRACMRSRGWQRVQVPVGEFNQFRGPEDAEDIALPPPSPFGGTRYDASQPQLREAEVKALCERPAGMRPARIVCPEQ